MLGLDSMNVNAVKPLTDVAELVSRLRSLMIMNQCVSACDSRVRVHTVNTHKQHVHKGYSYRGRGFLQEHLASSDSLVAK